MATEKALAAVRYMADAKNWHGNPLTHDAVLFGHYTPFELACEAVATLDEQDARKEGTDA